MVKERIRETNIQPTSSCPLVIGETKYDNRQLSELRINVKETDVFDYKCHNLSVFRSNNIKINNLLNSK